MLGELLLLEDAELLLIVLDDTELLDSAPYQYRSVPAIQTQPAPSIQTAVWGELLEAVLLETVLLESVLVLDELIDDWLLVLERSKTSVLLLSDEDEDELLEELE